MKSPMKGVISGILLLIISIVASMWYGGSNGFGAQCEELGLSEGSLQWEECVKDKVRGLNK